MPAPNPVVLTARIALGPHVGIAVARAKITTRETWSGVWSIADSTTGYTYIAWIQFNQTDADPSVLDRHFEVDSTSHMSAAPPASIAPCRIAPLRTNTISPGDGSLEVDYTASQAYPEVSATGGKTGPVTVSCEGMSYPALLGGSGCRPPRPLPTTIRSESRSTSVH